VSSVHGGGVDQSINGEAGEVTDKIATINQMSSKSTDELNDALKKIWAFALQAHPNRNVKISTTSSGNDGYKSY
jgi:hypothetical protein